MHALVSYDLLVASYYTVLCICSCTDGSQSFLYIEGTLHAVHAQCLTNQPLATA